MIKTSQTDDLIDKATARLNEAIANDSPVGAAEWVNVLRGLVLLGDDAYDDGDGNNESNS